MLPVVILVKCVSAVLITVTSAVGVWLPLACMGRGMQSTTALATPPPALPLIARADELDGQQERITGPTLSRRTHIALSLANCFAAGMLVTMAMTHFLPIAIAEDTAQPPATVAFYVLLGVLVPACIECTTTAGHSHGGAREGHSHHDGATHTASLTTATLLILLMCFHGAMEGMLLGLEPSATTLLSTLLPLSIHKFLDGIVVGVSLAKEYAQELECASPVYVAETTATLANSAVKKHEQVTSYMATAMTTTTTTTYVPIQQSNAVIPLSTPLYDTWQGVSSGGTAGRVAGDETGHVAIRHTMASTQPASAFLPLPQRSMWRASVVVWLLLTPCMLIGAMLLYGYDVHVWQSSDGLHTATHDTPASSRVGPTHTPLLTIVHGVGSGGFLYVGLSLLLQEETKGVQSGLALLLSTASTYMLFYLNDARRRK